MWCLLNVLWNWGHVLWHWILAGVFQLWETCSVVLLCSDVSVASDTFIQTKEAPVAVLSVAANSRGMSRCHHTKDEMFSLSLVFPLWNRNPPCAVVVTRHANVAAHKCTVQVLPRFKVCLHDVTEDLLWKMCFSWSVIQLSQETKDSHENTWEYKQFKLHVLLIVSLINPSISKDVW